MIFPSHTYLQLPCKSILPTKQPSVYQPTCWQVLNEAMEASRFTDIRQEKLLKAKPSRHGCPEVGLNQQARRGNCPLAAKALLVCSLSSLPASTLGSALPLPLLCPLVTHCAGRVTAGRKQPQKFLSSKTQLPAMPLTHLSHSSFWWQCGAGPAHNIRMFHVSTGFA